MLAGFYLLLNEQPVVGLAPRDAQDVEVGHRVSRVSAMKFMSHSWEALHHK